MASREIKYSCEIYLISYDETHFKRPFFVYTDQQILRFTRSLCIKVPYVWLLEVVQQTCSTTVPHQLVIEMRLGESDSQKSGPKSSQQKTWTKCRTQTKETGKNKQSQQQQTSRPNEY